MVNNVIGVVNYVIAARPSLLNFVIADMVTPEPHPKIGVGGTTLLTPGYSPGEFDLMPTWRTSALCSESQCSAALLTTSRL